MCRSLNLIIMNGRFGKDNQIVKKTCKDSSTVDYIIISTNLAEYVSDFDVLVFDPILSDIHCPVYAALTIETINKQSTINDKDHFLINKPKTKCICKSEDVALYKDKLSEVDCSYIEGKLNEAESGDEVVSIDIINNFVEDVSKLLRDVASDSVMSKPVMTKPSKPRRRSLPHKPWYNSDCESTRRTMLRYKKSTAS